METNHQSEQVSHLHPFLSIWTNPRETISRMMDGNRQNTVRLLVYISGIVMSLNLSLSAASGDVNSFGFIIVQTLIRGILYGFIGWYIFSGLIYGIGKIFKGTGTFKEIKTAYGWAQIPMLVVLVIIWPINFLVFGDELFRSTTPYLSGLQMSLNLVAILAEFVLTIWYVVIMSKAIGVGHHISSGKGFAVFLLSALAIFLVIFGGLMLVV